MRFDVGLGIARLTVSRVSQVRVFLIFLLYVLSPFRANPANNFNFDSLPLTYLTLN